MRSLKIVTLSLAGVCAAHLATAQTEYTQDAQDRPTQGPHEKLSQTRINSGSSETMLEETMVRASQLLGVNATSQQGENLGQVQDLVINPYSGKIEFALVGKGFMAGLGDKLIPVPWQAADLRSQKEFVLNIDRKKMDLAPHWSQSEFEEPDYILRIYRFYEFEPPVGVGGIGSGEHQSGQGQGSSSSEGLESSSTSSTQDGKPEDKATTPDDELK